MGIYRHAGYARVIAVDQTRTNPADTGGLPGKARVVAGSAAGCSSFQARGCWPRPRLACDAEVLVLASDARLVPVVVGAGEEVALPPHSVADPEMTDLHAVEQDAVAAGMALPDRDEAPALALLDLDLHAPCPVRQGRGGRDVSVHLERAAAVVERVVVTRRAGGALLVFVAALQVERDRVARRDCGRRERQEGEAGEEPGERSTREVPVH